MSALRPSLCLAALLLCSLACVPESTPADSGVHPDAAPIDAGVHPDAEPLDSGEHPDAEVDAGSMDAEPMDADPPDVMPDAGPSLCPTDPAPECATVQDCNDDISPPTNCDPCKPYNRAICAEGRCSMPAVLRPDDIYTLVINLAPNVTGVESFAAFAVAESAAGDRKLTCEDFYEDRVSLDNDCLNIIDTRAYALPQTGDTYALSYSQFASGQRTLFVVYGHRGAQPRGDRLGVSCTAIDVGPPTGNGPYLHEGAQMVRLPE